MPEDNFSSVPPSLHGPASGAVAIMPDDDTDLALATRAIYVGGGGDLAVVMTGGASVTLTAVPTGALLPLRVRRVLEAGTTATALIGLW